MTTIRLILAGGLLGLSTLAASAQSFAISPSAITGGGGESGGSQFAIRGHIGQHEATTTAMQGSRFGVTAGFEALLVVIQTPGAPHLTVTLDGGNVTISWPAQFTGWTLQQSGNLATLANWQSTSGVSNNSVTLPLATSRTFFRLTKSVSQ